MICSAATSLALSGSLSLTPTHLDGVAEELHQIQYQSVIPLLFRPRRRRDPERRPEQLLPELGERPLPLPLLLLLLRGFAVVVIVVDVAGRIGSSDSSGGRGNSGVALVAVLDDDARITTTNGSSISTAATTSSRSGTYPAAASSTATTSAITTATFGALRALCSIHHRVKGCGEPAAEKPVGAIAKNGQSRETPLMQYEHLKPFVFGGEGDGQQTNTAQERSRDRERAERGGRERRRAALGISGYEVG